FDPNGPDGIVAGLKEVLGALDCSTLSKISWLSRPSKVFDNLRPIDVLKLGRKDEVLSEAMAVGVAQ
ncbi:MAG: hypothetical protein ACRD3W_12300, partial [Terriglobales bacterium]